MSLLKLIKRIGLLFSLDLNGVNGVYTVPRTETPPPPPPNNQIGE